MTRYFVPAVFVAATAWVSWYNTSHPASKVLVPFVDVLFPSAAGNPEAMGERTVQVMAGVTVLILLFTVWEHFRALRRRAEDADA